MERFFKRPWLIVGAIGLVTLFFALQLPRARLDNNNFRFVPEKDPERVRSARIDETFGSQTMILIGLEREFGTVLEGDFLTRLRSLDRALREIDIVDSVASIVSTDYIDAQGDAIRASALIPEDFSGTPGEIALLREKLLDWDIYRRALVSDDFSSTQIVISLGVGSDEAGTPPVLESYRTILRLAEEAGFPSTSIYAAGLPVVSAEVNAATAKDLVFLVPLVVIVLLVVFFLSFKRASSVLMPLLTVAVSATWAIGAMPLFGISLSILSTVLPVILLAVGSAYGIHVVSHYYEEAAQRKSLSEEEHRLLVFAVLKRIGWPVFLAALTTFVGFASFCFTSVVPIREFGIFSSFGVMAAFGVSLTLLPALFIIRGPERARPKAWGKHYERVGEDPMSASIADALGAVVRKKRTTLAVAAAIIAVSIWGLSRMVIDNVLVEYFKPYTQVARSDAFIREKFGGTKAVSLVVKGRTPGDVLRPEVLAAVDGLASYLKAKVPEVGKITGFTDMIKRVNQVMNADADPSGLPRKAASAPIPESGAGGGAAGAEPA
ncbi:MAG TPA: MMPL family transporter, partial [Rectinemataceae bacterium]